MYRNKLEARVARLERLLIERSMGYGNEPSNAMKIWSFLRDNGPSTSADVKNIFPSSQRASIASMLTNMLKADCIRRQGNNLVANLDYKWDDVGVIPRTAQQELMNSVKNSVEPLAAKQSRTASNNTKRIPKANNLPDIKECIEQLEWKINRDLDADDIHVWNEDNKLFARVLICGKAYGDSYTEKYKVLYSINVKDYGDNHYTSTFDASKIIMQGDGVYDIDDLPRDQKSIDVYSDFRGIESLTITYVMEYD